MMPETDGCEWWPQEINASDTRNVWLNVVSAVDVSIFIITTSYFRLVAAAVTLSF